jgi:hypothetical protein
MKIQPKEVVDAAFYWDEWSRCVSSRYQRDQFYRFGQFDNCSRQWNDFKTAAKAKMAPTEEEAKEMLTTTYYHKKSNASPTVGVIWELKDPPSWQ